MNKTIYFIDDDTVANQLFKRSCDKIGLSCEVFDSAHKCLDQINASRPDIVLTDLNMPGMDGFELIELISNQWPSLPVIAVTGQSSVERAVRAMRAGACDFIRKPYELDDLKTSIDRNLQYADLARHTDAGPAKNYGMTWFSHDYDIASFPSGHSATALGVATAVALLFPRYRYPVLLYGALVTFSRVVITKHYFSDVLIGGYVGVLTSVFLYQRYFKR